MLFLKKKRKPIIYLLQLLELAEVDLLRLLLLMLLRTFFLDLFRLVHLHCLLLQEEGLRQPLLNRRQRGVQSVALLWEKKLPNVILVVWEM